MRLAARIAPFLLMLAAGCASGGRNGGATAGGSARWPIAATVADSVSTERLAPGVLLHRLVQVHAPWRAYVLDVDLTACVSLRSVKGAPVSVGRRTTSALLASIPPEELPIAAVNADFFLFAPPGVPVGPHIENGRLVSGPVERAAFGFTAARMPWMGRFTATATVRSPRGIIALRTWNRPTRNTPGVVDAAWGVALDSTITGTVWRLSPIAAEAGRFVADTLSDTESRIARGDTMFVFALPVAEAATLRHGDTVSIAREISEPSLQQAVGGFPIVMRDSVVSGAVDSVNNAAFRNVNPRTAVGVAANGTRVLIAVIDGRQAGYSAGMSLRETAALLRDMGARDAINLDGGGSSAMVVSDAASPSKARVVNKPSDAIGERPVANALAVTGVCRR